MSGINLDSPLNMFLVGVCVLAVLYLIYKVFFIKTTTTASLPTIALLPTTANKPYDVTAVNNALAASGVKTVGQENFEATTSSGVLVFDTINKINKNYSKFLATFFKNIDINYINDNIKKNGIDKTMANIETEKNINFYVLHMFMINNVLSRFVFFTGSLTDKILLGIASVAFLNIGLQQSNKNIKFYYLNDYEKYNDFIIYMVPSSYTGDTTKLNEDTSFILVDILKEQELTGNVMTTQSNKNIKFSLFKLLELNINKYVAQLNAESTPVNTTSSFSSFFEIYKQSTINNKDNLFKYLNLLISALYILCYKNSPLLETDNITKDILNITNTTTSPFTQEFIKLNNIKSSTFNELSFSLGFIAAIGLNSTA